MKYAVVIIDMTIDFVIGELISNKKSFIVIKPLQKLISFVHKNNVFVIYVSDAHTKEEYPMKV